MRRRIQRIIGMPNRTPMGGWFTTGLVIVGVLAGVAWLNSSRAVSAEDDDSQETTVLVQVVDRNGNPYSTTIHQARTSYAENMSDLKQWSPKAKATSITLQGLPAGKQTLIADARGGSPTIFHVDVADTPSGKVHTVRLDEGSNLQIGLPRDQLECRLRVIPVEGEEMDATLELEFTNTIDDPIRLPMFTMTTMNKRLFIPRSLHDGVITITGHSTQKLQLSWRAILQKCVWTGRNEPISEMVPINDPPKGQQYFRLNLGGQGLLPVALPTPERMLLGGAAGHDSSKAAGAESDGDWSSLEFSTDRLPPDMPLGNNGIAILDWRPAPQAAALRPKRGTEETGWMDAEYFLQYRIRVEENDRNDKPIASAIPLVYLDIRNKGEIDFGIEMNQSRQQLIVDDKVFSRSDQPWGGYDLIPKDGSFLTLPFLLSRDWRETDDHEESAKRLRLVAGKQMVRFDLSLFEIIPKQKGQATSGAGFQERSLRTREFEISIPETRGPTESDDLMIENIRRELVVYPRFHAPEVTENLKWLVLRGQPKSGDYLLSQTGHGTQSVPDPASNAIAQLWDSLTRSQIDRYLHESMEFFVRMREAYPCDVEAGIAVGPRFRTGYHGLPGGGSKLTSKTTTRHFLDGEIVGEPFDYELHTTVSAWIKTGKLKPGEHAIELETDYEFERDGERFSGTIRSPEYRFQMVPKDQMPDELIVIPEGEEEFEQIAEAIYVVEMQSGGTGLRGWQPQMRWSSTKELQFGSLHTPSVWLDETCPYDICVCPVIRIKGTEDHLWAAPIIAPAGGDGSGYLLVRDIKKAAAVLRRHADKDGFVEVEVALLPSRSIALSYPHIKKYLGLPTFSQTVRMRIDHDVPKGVPIAGTRQPEEPNDRGGPVRVGR